MEFLVYFAILCIPAFVAYTVWFSVFFSFCCYCKHKTKPSVMSCFIKFTLLGNLTKENKQYLLFNYPVQPWFVRAYFFSSITSWLVMFLAFWSTFLIQVTDSCIDNYDCFYLNSRDRIKDCQQVNTSEPWECLHLQVDFIKGAVSAGGIQSLMVTLQYGQFLLYAWSKKITRPRSISKKYKWKLAVVIAITILLVLCTLTVTAYFTPTPIPTNISQINTYLMLGFLTISTTVTSALLLIFLHTNRNESETNFDVSSSPKDLESSHAYSSSTLQ